MKNLAEKFKGLLDIIALQTNGAEIRITSPDKEIHPQILFEFYNEIFLLGYNVKVNVI